MCDFSQLFMIFLFIFMVSLGCNSRNSHQTNLGVSIFPADNTISKDCAKHLYDNLKDRTKERNTVLFQEDKKDFLTVNVVVDTRMEYDYHIDPTPRKLILKAKSEKIMKWLSFQFISLLAENHSNFYGEDLPPALIALEKHSGNFDFLYCEPHLQTNLMEGNNTEIFCTYSVDRDWGIWGHNLEKALESKNDMSIYALWEGQRTKEQYCFSSISLYNQLANYIMDNFGNSEEYIQRFMIMPNDNQYVCNCTNCLSLGNTKQNATPALSHIINKLATKFPHHLFFTAAYLTCVSPPETKWSHNTGVMISTIDIPRGVELNKQKEVKTFLNTLDQWRESTTHVYIWDYAANFDDYLTPVPVLYGLKKQLKFYKDKGIKGVFLNANGYEYSAFDDMKTYVAASLMMNIDLSVDTLCYGYYKKCYPVSGKLLCDYYLSMEKRLGILNKGYNMYGGFQETLNTYLDVDEFISFYDELDSIIIKTNGEEKEKLEKLLVALTFTRLQVAYFQRCKEHGFADVNGKYLIVKPQIQKFIDKLHQYKQYKDMSSYKESDGRLDLFIKNWENLLATIPLGNKLMGEPLKVLSQLDKDYNRIQILNDGVLGFDGEYHQGWLIYSGDNLNVCFGAENLKDAKNISLRFMINQKHKIYPPEKVIVYIDDMVHEEIKISWDSINTNRQIEKVQILIDLSKAKSVSIKIFNRKYPKGLLACDEILIN